MTRLRSQLNRLHGDTQLLRTAKPAFLIGLFKVLHLSIFPHLNTKNTKSYISLLKNPIYSQKGRSYGEQERPDQGPSKSGNRRQAAPGVMKTRFLKLNLSK